MAPAGGGGRGAARGLRAALAVAAALVRAALSLSERYPAVSLLKQELHRQRQGPAAEWAEQYAAECGETGPAMGLGPAPGWGWDGLGGSPGGVRVLSALPGVPQSHTRPGEPGISQNASLRDPGFVFSPSRCVLFSSEPEALGGSKEGFYSSCFSLGWV